MIMAKEKNLNGPGKPEDPIKEAIIQIGQLLHWKMNASQLKIVRDMVISSSHRNWNRKSYLGKALIFHWQKAESNSKYIQYHHLFMAELIRNFSIATELEYLEKCKEYRIHPFIDKEEKALPPDTPAISGEEWVDIMKRSLDEMGEEIDKERKDEIQNSNNQDYPICSFEELGGEINPN